MSVRDAKDRLMSRYAKMEREAGRLPDTRKIETQVTRDLNKAAANVKPGRSTPLTSNRGGER